MTRTQIGPWNPSPRVTAPTVTFADCHDECSWALFDLLSEAGYRFDLEPRHIFNSIIPAVVLLARQPPAIIPDAVGDAPMPPADTARHAPARRSRLPSRVLLWDVKTIQAGGSWYLSARARDDQSGAVAARAHRVNGGREGGEYGGHARELDA